MQEIPERELKTLRHLLKKRTWQLHAIKLKTFSKSRAHARRTKPAEHSSIFIDAFAVENENFLHGDRFALHAGNLRNRSNSTSAIAQASNLDYQVQRRGDLLPHRAIRQSHTCHLNHCFDSGQGVTRSVCVNRGKRTVVTCVHRLKHINGFGASYLTDHDSIGPHAQSVF